MKSKKITRASSELSPQYEGLLREIKDRVQAARLRASVSVNQELVFLYWQIGREILTRQGAEGYGTKVVDRLARDLKHEFPEMKGFSPRNLNYMLAFAAAWPDESLLQQLVAKVPWGHNVRVLDYCKAPAEREFYVRQTLEHGWSRNVLVHQIESRLYRRQGKAITNFDRLLPPPQSDLARDALKDPYCFDFLGIGPEVEERELHRGLVRHIRDFLIELGSGFAYVGSQHHLEVGGEDFYLDLLFYHLRLRAFVAIELKVGHFRPEFAGKLNFYLSALDDQMRAPGDRPSIGILLCKTRNQVVAEYALRDVGKPMGVATYRLLPGDLKSELPSIEQLEAELATKPRGKKP